MDEAYNLILDISFGFKLNNNFKEKRYQSCITADYNQLLYVLEGLTIKTYNWYFNRQWKAIYIHTLQAFFKEYCTEIITQNDLEK